MPKGLRLARLCSARQLDPSSLVPIEHPQRTKRVPPARFSYRFAKPEGERFVMRVIEEPSTVGLPLVFDQMHGIADASVRLVTGTPEVVERPKNVIMVAGRKGAL